MSSSFFEIINVSKSFPGVKALDRVSLNMEQGEVRALVGENGAGKSTLIKILNGNYRMDEGQILMEGHEVHIKNPAIAAQLGISIIFQEMELIDGLSVAENIFAGRLSEKGKIINWKDINERALKLLNRIGFKINPKTRVEELSNAGKQLVEIAKALSFDAKIILMDEPSATLTNTELEKLFDIVKDLKTKGISVLYISHRLEEIFEICDSITVMRDGRIIDTKPVSETTRDQIVEKMVGRTISQTFPKRTHLIGEEVLRVENLRQKNKDEAVSFSLHRGEVLGIAGLVGSGRTETMRALFGADYISGGDFFIKGEKAIIKSPEDAKKLKLAFITEDRKLEGLLLNYTVKSNIVMANLKSIVSGVFLNDRLENEVADKYIELIKIKTPTRNQKVLNLSGGNQQKVVVAKWLNASFDIIIMDEPTRGIDVGTKFEIYDLINNLAESGKAIIVISSELQEILGISDRVLVMKHNQIVAELSGSSINALEFIRHAL